MGNVREERRDPATGGKREADALANMKGHINRLFDDMWLKIGTQHHGFSGRAHSEVATDTDLSESAENLRLEIELPGIGIEDLEILAGPGELTVRGEKRTEREETGRTYALSERCYGAFTRTFGLPPGFEADQAQATLRDGVLCITVPKIPGATSTAKKIPITGA